MIRKVPAAIIDVLRLLPRMDSRASAIRGALIATVISSESPHMKNMRRDLGHNQSTIAGQDGLEMTVGSYHNAVSKPPHWAKFLRTLTLKLAPMSVLELGTGVGMSSCAISAGLPDRGHIWTIDGNAGASRAAGEALATVGFADRVTRIVGDFDAVLDDVLAEAEPIDLFFVDGNHQEGSTRDYFERSLLHLTNDAVIVFDDIHWSSGMDRVWRRLRADPRIGWTVDLGGMGVAARAPVSPSSPSRS